MKYIIFATIAIFTLTACGDKRKDTPPPVIDDLRPYVERFDNHYDGDWPERLDVYFDNIENCEEDETTCTAGFCKIDFDHEGFFREVVIDIDIWQELTEPRREGLVFHELGHCVLDRDHVAEDEISFMHPFIQGTDWYVENRMELYLEMFDKLPIDDLLQVQAKPNEKPYMQ